jgi:hypothetical protein
MTGISILCSSCACPEWTIKQCRRYRAMSGTPEYLRRHSAHIERAGRWHTLCSTGQAHKLVSVARHRQRNIPDPERPSKVVEVTEYSV